jgi:hypothetical protein
VNRRKVDLQRTRDRGLDAFEQEDRKHCKHHGSVSAAAQTRDEGRS